MAREIARPLGLAVAPRCLVRQRDTRPQAGLDAASRERNVAGAFACRRPPKPLPTRVWLVDDVTTVRNLVFLRGAGGFGAAGCDQETGGGDEGANQPQIDRLMNLALPRDVEDAAHYLGPDYPYFYDEDEGPVSAFRRARADFGGPIWNRARDRMLAISEVAR